MKILILLITFLFTSVAFSEEQKKYDFYWDNIPVVCAAPEEIDRWAEHKGFTPLSVSYGREGGKPDGQVVYIVVYYLNRDNEEYNEIAYVKKQLNYLRDLNSNETQRKTAINLITKG